MSCKKYSDKTLGMRIKTSKTCAQVTRKKKISNLILRLVGQLRVRRCTTVLSSSGMRIELEQLSTAGAPLLLYLTPQNV